MNLKPTNALLMALQAAADGQFVCYPSWSPHVPGWGWECGGDVALHVQGSLSQLHHARLVDVNRSGRFHVDGDPVVLTVSGVERLAAWRLWATALSART